MSQLEENGNESPHHYYYLDPSYNIAFNCLVVTNGQWAETYDKIFMTNDQGPGQVPLGDQGSGRGASGECQLGVNSQFLSKIGNKSVKFCLKSAKKVFNL